MIALADIRARILLALPSAGPVVVQELPRLTGLDEQAVALGVASLFGEGAVRAWSWCGAHFVAREARS